MIKIVIISALLLLITGCSTKKIDYSIHKPKVRFKPSQRALDRLKYETMGHPYVWGAENDGRYDCSGLTYYSFGSMGVEIPRVANDQFNSGVPISRDELQKGDLVFFATSRRRPGIATHVGIYLGNDKFQHASSSKRRVVVSSLNKSYYANHYIGARRYYNFEGYKAFKPSTPTFNSRKTTINRQEVEDNLVVENTHTRGATNPFIDNSNSALKEGRGSYYIVLYSRGQQSSLLTKLELSGLNASLNENGNIEIGPFSSQSEAIDLKNQNLELLSNADIEAKI